MDGIITPEQLQALEAQAVQEQANLSQASIRPSLERDAALVAEYAKKSAQQVRQPSSISEFFFKGPVVPIEERLGYAREAARLQGDIQRRIQEAGLMQGPVQQTQAEQVAPQSSQEQPQPAAPPSPAQPVPAPEKPQRDPFKEFREIEEKKRDFFGFALSEMKGLPAKYHGEAMKLVKDYWEMTGPKLPPNALLPVQNPLTGDMIQGMAMTPEGKIVEIPGASQELPKELSPIATKRAEAISYADQSLAQLDSLLGKLKDPKISDNDKIIAGKDFLPAYNRIQSQGPNVLGVDEAKRTGQALETEYGNLLNIFNEKQVIGTDLPRFIKQLESTKSTIQSARKQELETLRRLSPKTASYFDTVDTRERQQQSAPGGVLIYNQGTKSFAPAR